MLDLIAEEFLDEDEGGYAGGADDEYGRHETHHLVPARLVRIAHRLKQLDESDDSSTIQALSRMKLPQMTGQIRDVEQRALELQREEGREEFRVCSLHHNLIHHAVPASVATARNDAAMPSLYTGFGGVQAGGVGGASASGATASAAVVSSQPWREAGHVSGTSSIGQSAAPSPRKAYQASSAALPVASPARQIGGSSTVHELDGGDGGDGTRASKSASASVGMSHTFGGAHSLSDALSHGASSTIAAMLAAGGPFIAPTQPAPPQLASEGRAAASSSKSTGRSPGASPGEWKRQKATTSSLSFRIVSASQMSAMRHSGSDSATTIVMRNSLCDVQLAKRASSMPSNVD